METSIERLILGIYDSEIEDYIISSHYVAYDEELFSLIGKAFGVNLESLENRTGILDETSFFHGRMVALRENDDALYDLMTDFFTAIKATLGDEHPVLKFDLCCATVRLGAEKYLYSFILEHRKGYINSLAYESGEPVVELLQHQSIVSFSPKSVSNYIILNLNDMEIMFKEKPKSTLDFYNAILKVRAEASAKTIFKVFDKAVQKVIDSHYDNNVFEFNRINQEIVGMLDSEAVISPSKMIREVFQAEEDRAVLERAFEKNRIELDSERTLDDLEREHLISNRVYVTETGVEIKLPAAIRSEQVEYNQNEDGTLSLLIKNVKMKK